MKSVGAVLAGWFSMTALVVVATGVAAALMTDGSPQPSQPYLVLNLVYSASFASLGGWVTARLAPADGRLHVIALAGLIAALAVASAVAAPEQRGQPSWYGALIAALGVAGVLAGGWVALHRSSRAASARSASA